jgi:DmsE family decaheme c-type cytochrome
MSGLRVIFTLALLAPSAALAVDYVGSNVCRTCHPDIWANFYRNPHYKSLASGKEAPENTGCEGCHGPGQAHVQARGGKASIVAFSQLAPDKVLDTCLRCHGQTLSRANIRRSVHTQEEVVCINCHSVHRSQSPRFLLARRQADLCYGCHSSVRAQFAMPFKHRVNEGVVQCTDCHNPHGAFTPSYTMGSRPRMMEHADVNEEPCLKCHADKRGPFVYEHAAVRLEGCRSCHNPHGSMNARMLRRPTVFTTCLECHNGAGEFGRRANGEIHQSSTHNMADPRYQNCTTCHVRIHGSNSDSFFLR